MKSLSPLIVSIIFGVLCLLAVFGIVFLAIRPTSAKIASAQARLDAASPDATDAAHTSAVKQVALAKVAVAQIKEQWSEKQRALMPPFDVSDRTRAQQQLTNELSNNLGQSLERWIKRTNVVPLTSIAISSPPLSPNDPMIASSPLIVPLGTVKVGGDFHGLLNHVLQWQNFNRLVLIDGLALHGNSPYMSAEYTAKVFLFPQNPDRVGPPVAGAGTGAPAPGGQGGYPGSYPGSGGR